MEEEKIILGKVTLGYLSIPLETRRASE